MLLARINEETDKRVFRPLKVIENLLFILFVMVMSVLIFIAAQSRFLGREPTLFGHRLYIMDSGSMSPTIKLDSMIIVKELEPEDIREKDIITYYGNSESIRVTHRVVKVLDDGKSFITRGDANNTDDPMLLDGDRIIGKVIFVIPLIGRLFRFLSTTQGIVSVALLGALWIALPKLLAYKGRNHGTNKQPIVGTNDSKEED